ncbi:MAG: DUF1254 domain-containing protein [Planctomycetes bacterium]|nr:DUF1254 domain-containing protein [Planctomycetota bacterium]
MSALLLIMLLATGSARGSSLAPLPSLTGGGEAILDATEARAVAAEAYVWGWPLAYVHQVRVALERVPFPGRSGGMPVAPVNRLAMLADRATHRLRGVACPNQDVFYGFGMFDLEASPVVLQVPDFRGRFWLYQLGDQRTDAFADFGSMHGTKPGCYLVVGPAWSGAVPAGIAGVVRSPTRYAYCIPRIFFSDVSGDREAALPLVNQVAAYPLNEYSGAMQSVDWSRARWLPDVTGKGRRAVNVSPAEFIAILPTLLIDVPPRPGEEPLYDRMRSLVLSIESDSALRQHAEEAATNVDHNVVAPLFHFRNVGEPLPSGWTTLVNGGEFGTDYRTRTAVAKSNVFVNRRRETAYYFLDVDAEGRRLEGSREYRLTFPRGSLPPARGFWSLTVYDERHALPEDAGGRHSIGSRTQALEYNPDGSLTITIGPGEASAGEGVSPAACNRLTASAGGFSLYLRLYWPEQSVVDGSWSPPALLASSRPTTPAEIDQAGDAHGSAPSQDLAVSLTYVDFEGRSRDSRP